MSYRNFDTFEALERSIKRVGDKWVVVNNDIDNNTRYKSQWSMLNLLDQFVANEEKDYKEKLNAMRSTYAPNFLAEQERKLSSEFNSFVEKAKEQTKADIKALAEKKQNKVVEMLITTPTAEQVRLLTVLQMRKDIDVVELHHILPTFFNNYQAMRVLDTIGKENGITLKIPTQLDCRVMFENIKTATEYLLNAVDEIGKPKKKRNIKYDAFFTFNSDNPDKCYDPIFCNIIEVFDTVPQLNDCKTEKSGLNSVEQMKVDWYFRDADKSNEQELIVYTENVVTRHPEIAPLLKYTPYGEYLDIIVKASAEGKDK